MSTMNWHEEQGALVRSFRFTDFSEAFAFMTRVALIAEKMDHHPDWRNVYNTVEIRLSTHSAGNTITDKDRQLAQAIDRLLGE
jgi:4a-hydroxytetrahydrobiopterin dehydratase